MSISSRRGRLHVHLGAGKGQQGAGEPVEPSRLSFDVLEEAVALGRVLGAGLQHLDGARDRGQRALQLVGCVRDELSFGPVPAFPVGDVLQQATGAVIRPPAPRIGAALTLITERCSPGPTMTSDSPETISPSRARARGNSSGSYLAPWSLRARSMPCSGCPSAMPSSFRACSFTVRIRPLAPRR